LHLSIDVHLKKNYISLLIADKARVILSSHSRTSLKWVNLRPNLPQIIQLAASS